MENNFINEYPCCYTAEHNFLHSRGFRYNFVKIIDGVTTWKYPKTKQLYETLIEYYYKNN